MAVIINEFEIVSDQSEDASKDENAPAPPQQASIMSASDLRDLLRRQNERMARLWAH